MLQLRWILVFTSGLTCLPLHAFFTPAFTPAFHYHPTTRLDAHGTRRSLLSTALLSPTLFLAPNSASGRVTFDIDRYGDKELKVSTVNKLRTNVGNVLLEKPTLGADFIRLFVLDALNYDASSGSKGLGGADGTVLDRVTKSKSSPLKEAASELLKIKKLLSRFEITAGDIVSYAGAYTIETFGGPRVTVQLGKTDTLIERRNLDPKFGKVDFNEVVFEDFEKSGLGAKEASVMVGVIGEVERLGATADSKSVMGGVVEKDEFTCETCGDEEVFIPESFGSPKDMYGEKVVKDVKKKNGVSTTRSKSAITNDPDAKGTDAIDLTYVKGVVKRGERKGVFANDLVWAQTVYYAGQKEARFEKDLLASYEKVVNVGADYVGGKQATILELSKTR